MSGIAHREARAMAPLICAALALLTPLQYRRPAANFIRAPPILLRPAIDGPTGQLDEADSLRAEIQNDLGHRRLREAALGLTRLARLTNSLPEPQLYDAALAAFTAAPSQHRLVMRLAALHDSYPSTETPPSSEAAEAFVVSAAEQKLWSASLGWWEQLGADAIAASIPAREAAVHSMARVGRYAQAEALLKQLEPTARGLRLVLSACAAQQERVGAATRSKAAGGLTAAALARHSFTLATDAEVADASMLRDCLSTCADAGEHADGLALLSSAPLDLHADAAVETLAGILHGGRGDAAASIAALHRARRISATAPAVAESLPPPLVPSRHLETLFLACARAGCWRDARWLLRASAGEDNALTPAAAAAALAACAQGSDGSLSTMRNKRRLALSAVATYRMEVAEEAAGLDMGELRGEASTAPWASAVLWGRLHGLLRARADGKGEAAALDALEVLMRHEGAAIPASMRACLLVLRALASHPTLHGEACKLFERLAAQTTAEELPVEACQIVLPLYEAAGRWRDALNLPHVTPSAYAFSRALELDCDQEAWLRVAESTRSLRWAGRREAAVGRWREEVIDGSKGGAADGRLRTALRKVLQLDPTDDQQIDFESRLVTMARDGKPMPRGVAAKLAYQQVGKEALRRARTVLRRAADSGAKLDGQAYSALCTAHAAMGSNQEAASLALEAIEDRQVELSSPAYLAALASVRSPNDLKRLVAGMSSSERMRWMRYYSDSFAGSFLAVTGALGIGGNEGRTVPALARASESEIHTALSALAMLESGVGGVTSMLQDLKANNVEVTSATRCMLLSTAMLEGWVQQQLALNVWLPLLSPHGEALEELLRPSLIFVQTPPESGFKGAYCFDWRAPTTHPVLVEWMKLRALTDTRFDSSSPYCGLCPVDLGVHVLEGMLLARGGSDASSVLLPPSGGWAKQLRQLRQSLEALVVRYEAAATPVAAPQASSAASGRGGRGARGFKEKTTAVTAPALSSLKGVLREILVALDLQQGIRYGGQLQSARVFVLALEQLFAQLSRSNPQLVAPGQQQQPAGKSVGGKGGKRKSTRGTLTKKERKVADELSREGWVGEGAVDPSPQRSAVAIAACMSLLLESPA